MRKIFSLLLVLLAFYSNARHISQDEAAAIASEFFRSDMVQQSLPPGPAHAPSFYPYGTSASQSYYVFNNSNGQGFVIISGDTRTRRVLGYSDSGSFNFNNLPPQLAEMLKLYEENIKSLPVSATTDSSWVVSAESCAANDGVLLETANWGQGYPYNALTPEIDKGHCPTGCVATAMAIVMKYHSWPAKARSFNIVLQGETDVNIDFSQYSFNYEEMPLSFNNENEEIISNEISKLMLAAGQSVHMEYGKEESGAYFQIVSHELQEKFSYSPECVFLMKSDYTWEEWTKIIRNEIDNRRPVLYSGISDSNDKHAFVCDGYSADGLFHINWGWDGVNNGFFCLDTFLYSNLPSMVVNIEPDRTGKLYARPYTLHDDIYTLFEESNFINVSVPNIIQGIKFDIGSPTIRVPYRFNGDLGIALTDNSGNIKEVLGAYRIYGDGYQPYLPYGGGKDFQLFGLSISESVKKTDKLHLIARESENDEWRLVLGCPSIPSSMDVEKCNNKMTNISVSLDPQLVMERCDMTGSMVPITNGSFSLLFGSHVDLRCHIESDKDCYSIVSISGKGAYSDNFAFMGTPEDKSIDYAFKGIGDYSIIGKVIEYAAPLGIFVETAGTLPDLIGTDDAEKVGDLTLRGNINAFDLWYIRENMKGLRRLDLKNVKIQGVNTSGVSVNGFIVSEYQPDDAMPDWALESLSLLNEIILPSDLKCLMNLSLSGLRITSITLPATLIDFGFNNFFVCSKLDEVINLSPIPVLINDCNFTGTQCPEEATLLVPMESMAAYKEAPVWKDFKNIYPVGTVLPERIEFSESMVLLNKNECKSLLVTFFPENVDIKDLHWESENDDVVTVTKDGIITGINYGSTYVHVYTANNKTASCLVIVDNLSVEQVVIYPQIWRGNVGSSFNISVDIIPSNANDKTVVWTSSDESVASVNTEGTVTAVSSGEAIISATCGEVSASCQVFVNPILVEALNISPNVWSGREGEIFQISAEIKPDNATNKKLEWSTSDAKVATVDHSGLVSVLKDGTCRIIVATTDESNITAECIITSKEEVGLNSIFSDDNVKVDVYTINGVLLNPQCDKDGLKLLVPGVYIVRSDKDTKKMVIYKTH